MLSSSSLILAKSRNRLTQEMKRSEILQGRLNLMWIQWDGKNKHFLGPEKTPTVNNEKPTKTQRSSSTIQHPLWTRSILIPRQRSKEQLRTLPLNRSKRRPSAIQNTRTTWHVPAQQLHRSSDFLVGGAGCAHLEKYEDFVNGFRMTSHILMKWKVIIQSCLKPPTRLTYVIQRPEWVWHITKYMENKKTSCLKPPVPASQFPGQELLAERRCCAMSSALLLSRIAAWAVSRGNRGDQVSLGAKPSIWVTRPGKHTKNDGKIHHF